MAGSSEIWVGHVRSAARQNESEKNTRESHQVLVDDEAYKKPEIEKRKLATDRARATLAKAKAEREKKRAKTIG